MARHGPALEKRQALLGRLVDVAVRLVAIATTCSYAAARLERDESDRSPLDLADLFCRDARRRVGDLFRGARSNDDRYLWLEEGIVRACEEREARAPLASTERPSRGAARVRGFERPVRGTAGSTLERTAIEAGPARPTSPRVRAQSVPPTREG